MKSYAFAMLIALSLGGLPVLTGCDREVSHTEQTHTNPDGTVTHSQDTVKKDVNGNTVHEHDATTH